jgi:dTDP-4-dehydrorhamnose reductase
MRIIVTGAGGRLGPVVAREFAAAGHHVTALGHAELDICDPAQLAATCGRVHPHALVNCASYNAVDAAETDPDAAFALNASGPAILAAAARAHNALFVHYSTDFVFDGETGRPYGEDDPPNPLSVYGRSKLEGEREAQRAGCHYVLRLSSLFGGVAAGSHRAAIDWIADTILSGMPVRAFVDRTVSPSYADDVARATRMLIEKKGPYGTYHCVSSGFVSWYDLAVTIALELGMAADIEATSSIVSQAAARRPRFCALSNQRLRDRGIDMPTWQSAVSRHMATRQIEAAANASL